MTEIEPAKEKDNFEVIKVEFERTYDTTLAGHDPYISTSEHYDMVYPNGLVIGLGQREGEESWGHWNYDFKTKTKNWEVVEIPENPRVIVEPDDGVLTEMGILTKKWLETHEYMNKDCRKFVIAGLKDFKKRTGQE